MRVIVGEGELVCAVVRGRGCEVVRVNESERWKEAEQLALQGPKRICV